MKREYGIQCVYQTNEWGWVFHPDEKGNLSLDDAHKMVATLEKRAIGSALKYRIVCRDVPEWEVLDDDAAGS